MKWYIFMLVYIILWCKADSKTFPKRHARRRQMTFSRYQNRKVPYTHETSDLVYSQLPRAAYVKEKLVTKRFYAGEPWTFDQKQLIPSYEPVLANDGVTSHSESNRNQYLLSHDGFVLENGFDGQSQGDDDDSTIYDTEKPVIESDQPTFTGEPNNAERTHVRDDGFNVQQTLSRKGRPTYNRQQSFGGTYFPVGFGEIPGGAIAIANSYSTGPSGTARSHATAYGGPY